MTRPRTQDRSAARSQKAATTPGHQTGETGTDQPQD
jgi:hypothetical protein